jgi:hypothetical protein
MAARSKNQKCSFINFWLRNGAQFYLSHCVSRLVNDCILTANSSNRNNSNNNWYRNILFHCFIK